MKLSCNVTGQERKSLVGAVSQELNAAAKYLGAPTFAYEVGGYRIDRAGTVVGMDDEELVGKLAAKGFTGEAEYDSPPLCVEETPEFGLGANRSGPVGEDETQAGGETDGGRFAVEMPLDGFTLEKLGNLAKLVSAKAPLLKAALGAEELPVRHAGGALRFPWFGAGADGETARAYATLVKKICAAAKAKQRVTAKEREVENPKYAMRCWLLSLGFIGDEYKAARKILLARLPGNGAFKGGNHPGRG
jgi:hypothetical protein